MRETRPQGVVESWLQTGAPFTVDNISTSQVSARHPPSMTVYAPNSPKLFSQHVMRHATSSLSARLNSTMIRPRPGGSAPSTQKRSPRHSGPP